MTADQSKFTDLKARTLSALLMSAIGLGAIWLGGLWFFALCCVVAALLLWELTRMVAPESGLDVPFAVLAAASFTSAWLMPFPFVFAFLCVPAIVGAILLRQHRMIFVGYAALAMMASFGLYIIRADIGLVLIIWLISVVVVSDVAGYFAGRVIGGPKFWPKISPKKTWSGTVAGWIGAGVIGLIIMQDKHDLLLGFTVSAIAAFAGQLGDIAESAIKRKMGVKDSSNLIPGHGGVMDRFDALIGATTFVLILLVAIGAFEGFGDVR